ncbi:MAG: endonuclease VII domain-containing protein [Actinomycetota bacterium]
MKRCRICKRELPLTEFYAMAGMRDGHRNECKRCNLATRAERYRENPEPTRERVKRWKIANPEREAARHAAYRASGRKGISDRKSYLKRKYGITPEDYDQLLAEQDGVCAICGRPPRTDIALHVDHDHTTGRIRGLLCFRCNNALGDFDDDHDRLAAALHYLGPVPKSEAVVRRLQELVRRPA